MPVRVASVHRVLRWVPSARHLQCRPGPLRYARATSPPFASLPYLDSFLITFVTA